MKRAHHRKGLHSLGKCKTVVGLPFHGQSYFKGAPLTKLKTLHETKRVTAHLRTNPVHILTGALTFMEKITTSISGF